jgi:hypothetical protein
MASVGVSLGDLLYLRRPRPSATNHDLLERWNLPRGDYVTALLRRGDNSQVSTRSEWRRLLHARRVHRICAEMEKTWRDWPDNLRGRLLHAIDQAVFAAVAHRVYGRPEFDPDAILRRAIRNARSAVKAERKGRTKRAQELAREAVAQAEHGFLLFGLQDARSGFAVLIDQLHAQVRDRSLPFPPVSLLGSLIELAAAGDSELWDRRSRPDDVRPFARYGRGRVRRPRLSGAQLRLLEHARSIAKSRPVNHTDDSCSVVLG